MSPIIIDGNLSKPIWQHAQWSDLFDDIRGPSDAPQSERPPLSCATRIKMLYDDNYLYIGAMLHADPEHPVITSFTKRNDPIFQLDSDFEVFIDPTRTTHNYKEFEVNAYNTVWNLLLNKPYVDGGQEHSGRIAQPGQDLYYDVLRQQSAVQILHGDVNTQSYTQWSVEIAMAFTDLLVAKEEMNDIAAIITSADSISHPMEIVHPFLQNDHDDHYWRINFSRVERQGKINWTWQPQIQWNPYEQRYQGVVDMHQPDSWGYLVFGDFVEEELLNSLSNTDKGDDYAAGATEDDLKNAASTAGTYSPPHDPTWPIRMAAMNIYSAQHAYFEASRTGTQDMSQSKILQEKTNSAKVQENIPNDDAHNNMSVAAGHFASHWNDLKPWLDVDLFKDTIVTHVTIELSKDQDTFVAILVGVDPTAGGDDDGRLSPGELMTYHATIRQDRFLQVTTMDSRSSTST